MSTEPNKLKKIIGIAMISSPFLGFLILLPTVTHSWHEAFMGYTVGFGLSLMIVIGVWLI